jgi:hypothetical protein
MKVYAQNTSINLYVVAEMRRDAKLNNYSIEILCKKIHLVSNFKERLRAGRDNTCSPVRMQQSEITTVARSRTYFWASLAEKIRR